MLRALKFFPCGLLKACWRPQGKNGKRCIENGEACAKGVTGRMPWRDLLRRSHLPPRVIAECEAAGSGGRPGRVNAATEATAAEPGLQPADPDPAVGAIAPSRSDVNGCRPERAGPEPAR